MTSTSTYLAPVPTARTGMERYRLWLLGAALVYVLICAFDSTLIYDDPYIIGFYRRLFPQKSLGEILRTLFFVVDLEGREYRLYGISKILHLIIWYFADAHAWVYASIMSAAQFASGLGIYKILNRVNADRFQAVAIAAAWVLSPFSFTTCFHHYSYLLLPYQLTIACAVLMQSIQQQDASVTRGRVGLFVFGFLLASTGESHFPATALILALVLVHTPSVRSLQSRGIDLTIVLATMALTVMVHRWGWHVLTDPMHSSVQRYTFANPSWQVIKTNCYYFFRSLPLGIQDQIQPMLALAGAWAIIVVLLVLLLIFKLQRSSCIESFAAPSSSTGIGLSVSLLILIAASILIIWLLSVFTNQVSPSLPRRYGYVPYTITAIFLVSLLSAPVLRRYLGKTPALAGLGVLSFFWILLTLVCLPIIRAQDARVWRETAAAIHNRRNVTVLFVNSWNHYNQPGFAFGVGTPGLRGENFPQIFESPLSNYWWESLYANAALGARFSAYRFDDDDATSARLTGTGLDGQPSQRVRHESIVVLADTSLRSSVFPGIRYRPSVFEKWSDFLQSSAAHNGATIQTGWLPFVTPPAPDDVEIDLGETAPTVRGVLMDKDFRDPSASTSLLANYGAEEPPGQAFSTATRGPLTYLVSNRHFNFTYRLDFSDRTPKIISLDLLDSWHDTPGSRRMLVYAKFDDSPWFHIGKVVDPSEWVAGVPLTIKLYPGGAGTVRIRMNQAPGSPDIPFLDGIRIARVGP